MNPYRCKQTVLYVKAPLFLRRVAIRRPPTCTSIELLFELYVHVRRVKAARDMYFAIVDDRLSLFFYGDDNMGKKRSNRANVKWRGWREVNLTKGDKEAIGSYLPDSDSLLDTLGEVVTSGYRFGFHYDEDRDLVSARLTGLKGTPNMGYSLSSRARTPQKALRVVLFKHIKLSEEGVWGVSLSSEEDYMD